MGFIETSKYFEIFAIVLGKICSYEDLLIDSSILTIPSFYRSACKWLARNYYFY